MTLDEPTLTACESGPPGDMPTAFIDYPRECPELRKAFNAIGNLPKFKASVNLAMQRLRGK